MAERICSIEGCDKEVRARGWCSTHYRRWQSHGDVTVVSKPDFTRRLRPCPGGCGKDAPTTHPRGRLCDDCHKKARAAATKRHRDNRKKRPDYERPFLREQHGMTELDYARMLVAQDGRCAGCDRVPPVAGRQLHIDHDHRCCAKGGRSCIRCRRGLLCAECNMALGLLADDPQRLENLAAYLRKWREVVEGG